MYFYYAPCLCCTRCHSSLGCWESDLWRALCSLVRLLFHIRVGSFLVHTSTANIFTLAYARHFIRPLPFRLLVFFPLSSVLHGWRFPSCFCFFVCFVLQSYVDCALNLAIALLGISGFVCTCHMSVPPCTLHDILRDVFFLPGS